ncbi:MAG: peptidylprolyl isomerase [Candidatus Obscuribacterales bacterium]|nr:peptidylprolyl isomerase [Candidatus Obscuribacterales bacterium]
MKRRSLLSGLIAIALALGTSAISLPLYAQANSDQFVRLETTKGPITMRIFYSLLPYTAGNFLDLVESGFYNGLIFHRVENWVIQGGDPNGNGSGAATDAQGQPKYIRLETRPDLNHNQAGMLAMARSNNPNSASCQFYILKAPMPQLNGKYAVFGKVLNGMNAVYAMRPGDKILSATILEQNNSSQSSSSTSSSSSSSSSSSADSGFGDGSTKRPPLKDSGF